MAEQYSSRRNRGIIFPLLVIAAGLLLLANNLGVISWAVWSNLWRFWPVLLILIGLQAILGISRWTSWIFGILAILIIAGVIVLTAAQDNPTIDNWVTQHVGNVHLPQTMPMMGNLTPADSTETVKKEDYPAATDRKLTAEIGIGKLVVNDSSDIYFLNSASHFAQGAGEPQLTKNLNDTTLELGFTQKSWSNFFQGISNLEYDLTLGLPGIPTDVSAKTGTGNSDINFDQLALRNFSNEVGTGSSTVKLGASSLPANSFSLKVGTGSMSVSLPNEIGMRLKYSVGVGSLSIDGQSLKGSGTYTTSNYDQAAKKNDIDISIGTGTVKINR